MMASPVFLYGTAGFRGKASTLLTVCYRVGLVAALRSVQMSKYTGVMITASHNPIEDNGVKLVDSNGEMLAGEWEAIAEEFVNAGDLQKVIEKYYQRLPAKSCVIIAGDNRPSTEGLLRELTAGIEQVGGCVHNYGTTTTPILQYLVQAANQHHFLINPQHYYSSLSAGFQALLSCPRLATTGHYQSQLTVDCSGGVGSIPLNHIQFPADFRLEIANTDANQLNDGCGAEHVHKTQTLPRGVSGTGKCAALDGDADRLVYFTSEPAFQLFDGERIMSLILLVIQRLIEAENETIAVGTVTTAYTNAAAVHFIESQGAVIPIQPVEIQPTGVKYLHPVAKRLPIGIYFESNGHGTVLVQDEVFHRLQSKPESRLLSFLQLANQVTPLGSKWGTP